MPSTDTDTCISHFKTDSTLQRTGHELVALCLNAIRHLIVPGVWLEI